MSIALMSPAGRGGDEEEEMMKRRREEGSGGRECCGGGRAARALYGAAGEAGRSGDETLAKLRAGARPASLPAPPHPHPGPSPPVPPVPGGDGPRAGRGHPQPCCGAGRARLAGQIPPVLGCCPDTRACVILHF